jgi:hypothetical protein
MHDDEIVLGDNLSRFIPGSRRNALNEIEEAVATGRDMALC